MLRQSFLLVFFILLAGCAHHKMPPVVKASKQIRKFDTFNQIKVKGNINITLHSGYSKPKVVLTGSENDLRQVITKVSGNTLVVNLGKGYPKQGQVSAVIYAGKLHLFEYHGAGNIDGQKIESNLIDFIIDNKSRTRLGGDLVIRKLQVKGAGNVAISGIRSHNLSMNLAGASNTSLKGMANISEINAADKAQLNFYWINGKQLRVRARDSSSISLAGVTTMLDLETCDKATFKGRYLRADRAFVRAGALRGVRRPTRRSTPDRVDGGLASTGVGKSVDAI
jgi:hypothetical protein